MPKKYNKSGEPHQKTRDDLWQKKDVKKLWENKLTKNIGEASNMANLTNNLLVQVSKKWNIIGCLDMG